MIYDHKLEYEATHLWRKVITDVGANHELGNLIWKYKLYFSRDKKLFLEVEKELRKLVVKLRLANL